MARVGIRPYQRRRVAGPYRTREECLVGQQRRRLLPRIGFDRNPHHRPLILDRRDPAGQMGLIVGDADTTAIGTHGHDAARGRKDIMPADKTRDKTLAGFSKISRGLPCWRMRPSSITTIRSASAIASSWLCVTWMKRDAELALQALQFLAHAHAQKRVERRQRLVEQQHLRLGDQRARQRDALLLAAGELRRQALGELLHLDQFEELRAPSRAARPSPTPRIFRLNATLSRQLRCGNSA